MPILETLLANQAQSAPNLLNTGLGLLLEGHNDRRQLRQQGELQKLQISGQKQLTDYNMMKQLQMWKDTNYSAQMEELRKAGLNPGLVYGLSGGGATTSGNTASAVTGGQAPAGGQEVIQGQALGIQSQLAAAQVEVLKSQANLNNVEASKKGGVDTDLAKTSIESLKAGITNTTAQTALTKIQTGIADLQKTIVDSTQMDTIRLTDLAAQKAQEELTIIRNQADISTETKEAVTKTTQQNYINAVITGNLMKAQINVQNQNVQTQIAQIAQGWENLDQTEKERKIHGVIMTSGSKLMDKQAEYMLYNTIIEGAGAVMKGIGAAKVGGAKSFTTNSYIPATP